MSTTIVPPALSSELDARSDLSNARDLGPLETHDSVGVHAWQGVKNLWLSFALDGTDVTCLRLGPNAGEITHLQTWSKSGNMGGFDFTTPLGPMRVKVQFLGRSVVRCTSSLLPSRDTLISDWPRDLHMCGEEPGTIHTTQRGLRSGIVFASAKKPAPFTLFYFQNFSSLNDYFSAIERTPADSVGGTWPELGYAPPAGEQHVLPRAREVIVSDAYLALANTAPTSEEAVAALYLDLLAEVYLTLDRPATDYHDWPERAANTMRDLTLSPRCTYTRQGRRYLMPYVGDAQKPPESMVQFTVAANAGEYDAWRGADSRLTATLRGSAASFFNDELETVVRWLPGETFSDSQAEDDMSHEAMDSWYLHHSLFNVFRFARKGDESAKNLFLKSLPYVIRVARRFDYHWPIFFNLKSLDIIRGEAEPGKGGETDVAGLYALLMIHAHEMFGGAEYMQEAEVAIAHLHGLGFDLAYQLNTTGFAAEAALRLWKLTGKRRYLGLADVCLANLFDNMWLWQCTYGKALHYRTFFGLFPLRDAPYLAPYEELEAHAKFHEYLALGGDDIRPSLRLLIAEFQKYSLDRCWFYYPDALPIDVIAAKPRNGAIERALSVPLEDLEDGRAESGQVGQEIYGAGLAFALTSRHYMNLADGELRAYCSYPMYDFRADGTGKSTWQAGGDVRGVGELRIYATDITAAPKTVSAWTRVGEVRVPLRGTTSEHGHAVFPVRGGQTIEIAWLNADAAPDEGGVVIGPPA